MILHKDKELKVQYIDDLELYEITLIQNEDIDTEQLMLLDEKQALLLYKALKKKFDKD